MDILIAATIFAFVGTFICSLFEAVFYSVPAERVEALVLEGKESGKMLKALRQDVHRPISAILILNTMATTGASAIAGAAVIELFGASYLIVYSAVFCLALLVFAEVIPKTAGVVYSRQLAGLVARPLTYLVWLLTPFLYFFQLVTNALVRDEKQSEGMILAEELVVMARLGHQHGVIDDQEVEVVANIVGLADQTVRSIMIPRSVSFILDESTTVGEAAVMKEVLANTRIAVADSESREIVGFVLRGNILKSMANDNFDQTLDGLMQPPHFVGDQEALDVVLARAIDENQHVFTVIDEFGTDVGFISLESILGRILGRDLSDDDEKKDMQALARTRFELIRNQ